MLKHILAVGAVLGAFATPLAAQAAKPQSNEMTLTGTVIDLNCYVAGGAMGANHKGCAEACAKAGVQLGILSSDGTIYVPVSSKPADPTNPKLIPHAELMRIEEPPPEMRPDIADSERLLLCLFLRRYVTWCARARRFARMRGAAALHREVCRTQIKNINVTLSQRA